ncbi:glycoside hydrolase family 92 protein [Serpula lacrymans var. lacrymans S7.3]|uniref:Glycoside hydrolase family 92 protein n=2 Tax=Serpula lacrymans var. lacrymans TaxID=341189 RepID=F8PL93_SERL3|nr:glycoside hydrolase family 92 protein [Serpula lacrymans var. lacrymans S7.9]EGO04001.1 glycoside hydrolase family 92 protein [Serpula lacrymans var. lacrymans S7.3]EGO29920.1 glycoside hydrolase family 92 protein [Serpula lacrymans var. lacrymans S7.9]
MAKPGMDTDSPGNQAGYDADPTYNATGFSQLHDNGTGGSASLSNFKLWPFATCESFATCQTSLESRKVPRKLLADGSPDDIGSPGYFASNLSTDIRVELTSTRRTALHRYTFPAYSTEPRIVIDITNDAVTSSTEPTMEIDPTTGRVTGGARFQASFGPGRYNAYTCIDFKGEGYNFTSPAEYGVWIGDNPVQYSTNIIQVYTGFISETGGLLTFPPASNDSSLPTTILARVGVSFISPEQACANAEDEIPDFDFDGTVQQSRAAWNDILTRVQVDTTGVDNETVSLLYSSLYRTHIVPADYTDENPRWNSTEPYYDSFYCNWDTFRNLYPLMSLHDPVNFARIVRGMINIQQHEGWLPECRGSTDQQWIQGSSNADPILGEFWVKFSEYASTLNVSSTGLYNALLADAEDQPPNWDLQGRQATAWKQYNYIPQAIYQPGGADTKQVSRTLEYAFGDFAISQVSKLLNETADATKYVQRAGNFRNVWNPNITLPGYPEVTGMVQNRFVDGTFNYTDPRHCSVNDPTHATCYLNAANRDGFYESSPMVYSQFVPHDTAALIELQGGVQKFVNRLNIMFDQGYFDVTDEPSMQIPFMYHYANAPGLSTQQSRQIIAESFNTTVSGIPGNDDSGVMASYAFFYLAGMYPVPATRQYLLASPFFPQISFYNPIFNTTTTIKSNGFQGNPADGTGGNVFVKNVTIDGQPWQSNCYLDFDVFVKGSTVVLELTKDINVTCGAGADALPPSLSTGGFD